MATDDKVYKVRANLVLETNDPNAEVSLTLTPQFEPPMDELMPADGLREAIRADEAAASPSPAPTKYGRRATDIAVPAGGVHPEGRIGNI